MLVRASRLAAVAVVMAAAVALHAGEASADSPTCASPGYFCAWSGIGFGTDSSGAFGQWYGDSSNWPGAGGFMDGGIENNDSSVRNTSTGYRVRVFKYQGHGTQIYCVSAGVGYNLAATGRPADNGSSHVWNSGGSC